MSAADIGARLVNFDGCNDFVCDLTSCPKLPGKPAFRLLLVVVATAWFDAPPAAGQTPTDTALFNQVVHYQPQRNPPPQAPVAAPSARLTAAQNGPPAQSTSGSQASSPAPAGSIPPAAPSPVPALAATALPPAAARGLPPSPAQHFAEFAEAEPWVATRRSNVQLASYQGSSSQAGGEEALNSLSNRVEVLEKKGKEGDGKSKKSQGFERNVFGRIQGDTVSIGQSPGNIAQVGHSPNGTSFRRVRIGVQGEGHEVYFYRLEVDFSNPGQVLKQVPRVTDAYAEIRKLPFGTLRMGEFRVPLSTERLMSSNDTTFIERGLPQAFSPARQLGIMAYNSTENYFFSWYSDISTRNATDQGQQFGKAGRVDLTQRIVFLPWYDEPSGGRYLFHLGGAYEYQDVRNETVSYSTTPEAVLNYGTTSVLPKFISTGNITARDVQILQAEASTVLGPLSFQAEYYGVFANPTVNPANQNLFFSGWYVYGSFFLTGEHRVWNRDQAYYTAVTPFTNFFRVRGSDGSVIQGPGAWEIAARASQMNLSDRSVQGGLLNDFTLGLNWYMTQQMKIMANYIYAVNNVHNKQTYADLFVTRAQVVW